jgi:hypothetical protein
MVHPFFGCAFPAVPASKGSSLRSHVAGLRPAPLGSKSILPDIRFGKALIPAMLPHADDSVVLGRFAWGECPCGQLGAGKRLIAAAAWPSLIAEGIERRPAVKPAGGEEKEAVSYAARPSPRAGFGNRNWRTLC